MLEHVAMPSSFTAFMLAHPKPSVAHRKDRHTDNQDGDAGNYQYSFSHSSLSSAKLGR
jgi:hypothetical protein